MIDTTKAWRDLAASIINVCNMAAETRDGSQFVELLQRSLQTVGLWGGMLDGVPGMLCEAPTTDVGVPPVKVECAYTLLELERILMETGRKLDCMQEESDNHSKTIGLAINELRHDMHNRYMRVTDRLTDVEERLTRIEEREEANTIQADFNEFEECAARNITDLFKRMAKLERNTAELSKQHKKLVDDAETDNKATLSGLRCDNCGANAARYFVDGRSLYYIKCLKCHTYGPTAATEAGAWKRWYHMSGDVQVAEQADNNNSKETAEEGVPEISPCVSCREKKYKSSFGVW